MPGLRTQKDNTEPSREQVVLLGVCNEHVPSPEGKMCSGLHRNMQRLAEMPSPFSCKTTKCNKFGH